MNQKQIVNNENSELRKYSEIKIYLDVYNLLIIKKNIN